MCVSTLMPTWAQVGIEGLFEGERMNVCLNVFEWFVCIVYKNILCSQLYHSWRSNIYHLDMKKFNALST